MEQNPPEAASTPETDTPENAPAPETAPLEETVPIADAAPVAAPEAQPAAAVEPEPEPEAAPVPAAKPKPARRPPPPRAPGAAVEADMNILLSQIYADYDFDCTEDSPAGSKILDLWALPDDKKVPAPVAMPNSKGAALREKWPARGDTGRKRDYRLHVYISKTKDPGWGVPGKDILAICKDNTSGLLLLMADQRGYFLPANKVRDLCDLFTPVATAPFKITGPKLRKGVLARFFSLAGFARELVAARQHA
ncbi:MAG: hypothetical protein HY553_03605 [Elusimicrobia bacterium]|nr:hypothetical protein [Elusimicrobiota bacterium]